MNQRFVKALLLALCYLCLAEISSRAFWTVKYRVPFMKPGLVLEAYYRGLSAVEKSAPTPEDQNFDILLLGGSVLHDDWGTVEIELREQLVQDGYKNVRITNLACPAQTSRDSLLKYRALNTARFDLVVFYHGINESRANNVPPDLFRLDYGHFRWYEIVNLLSEYHGQSLFSLPYTLDFLRLRVSQVLRKGNYISVYEPKPEWVHFGRNLLSARAFDENLRAIVDMSVMRGERIMIMTYAYYIPTDYSEEAFEAKELDYGRHIIPVRMWGRKDSVAGALEAHNEVVRRVALEYEGILFVDQEQKIFDSSRYFNDPCHLTSAGSKAFAANMVEALHTETALSSVFRGAAQE